MTGSAASRATRNLRLYWLYVVTQYAPLYWPYMYQLVVHVRGYSPAEFGLLKAIYYAAVVVLEFPLGVLGDRFQRRTMLWIAALANVVAAGIYAGATSYAAYVVAEVVFALGSAAMSGSGSALLWDSLADEGRGAEYARADGYSVAAGLIGCTVGFPLADWLLVPGGDPTPAYAVTAGLSALGIVAALAMREPPRLRAASSREITRGAWRDLRHAPGVLSLLLYAACVGVLIRVAGALLYNPALEAGGVPVHFYGTVLAIVGLIGAGVAFRAGAILGRFGLSRVRAALPLTMLAMFALLPWSSGLGTAALLCVHGVAVGALPVVVRTGLNEGVSSSAQRATVLSLESVFVRGAYSLAAIAIGFALDAVSLDAALGLTIAIGAGLWWVSAWVGRARVRPAPG